MTDMPARMRQGSKVRRLGVTTAALAAAAAASAIAGSAAAQSASSTASQYKAGYGGIGPGGYAQPINVTTRDANGNLVIVDGVTQVGSDQSVFSHSSVGGAFDTYSGAGGLGSSTAFGNNLNVTVQGNYNTVVVNANQINNGNVSAGTQVLNGKVNLDGH